MTSSRRTTVTDLLRGVKRQLNIHDGRSAGSALRIDGLPGHTDPTNAEFAAHTHV
ncbi:hypothetical protein KIN20_023751 [Parelaphostrongylus tenuis]|uniref:Uncharacterized protein n=1 Tax=Parelaphostrongylus tenuis TaxID=148309 RepID=A0AAD5QWB2_PARTN|nr:hypothetical protein KIN20_023751 [Parelaphostrongylus tenuis]